jgi:hypothetical protein
LDASVGCRIAGVVDASASVVDVDAINEGLVVASDEAGDEDVASSWADASLISKTLVKARVRTTPANAMIFVCIFDLD